MSAEQPNPLWQLFLMRMRTFLREPGTVFWVFAFPLLTSLGLGLAFRRQSAEELSVAVVASSEAADTAKTLGATEGLRASILEESIAREALRRGEVTLLLDLRESPPALVFDPARPEARTARLLVLRTLEARAGLSHELSHREHPVTTPGSRYIDFLIPGMLGFGLMSSGIWGLGFGLVQMRKGRLLKRLAATPMRRSHFLLSYVFARVVLAVIEILFFVLFARLLFGVQMFGSTLTFFIVGLIGAMVFSAMALLIGSRAENTETASGLANLAIMPMMLLSGVFFSVSRFPGWLQPLIHALPLTALNDGLRAVMTDGKGFFDVGRELVILGGWGIACFVLALRWFRWT